MDENTKKQVEEVAKETFKNLSKSGTFTDRKITDTPTDAFAPVNRRFVTLSSNVGARPISSVAVTGQPFFNTTTNTPMVFDGNDWRNGVGSVVAAGRNS